MSVSPSSVTTARSARTVRPGSAIPGTVAYRRSRSLTAVIQLCTTLLPLAALLTAMHWSLDYSYLITLVLAVPAAGFLVRTFILMHDCAHGSFLPSKRANEIVGFITGVLTLTPFAQWRRDHALHHASSGDLARRGHGDIVTLTVDEYLARDRWGRFRYRLYRNPLILFGFGPLYLLVSQRWRTLGEATGKKQVTSVHATNIAIAAALIAFSLLIGFGSVLLIYTPVFLVAAAAGIWLFYVQHQFEETYWEDHQRWEYAAAAVEGSSYYRLPRILDWITGSIGLHHVHHADPRIPNYHLHRAHEENPVFHRATQITLRGSVRSARLRLWDARQRKMVGFDAVEGR